MYVLNLYECRILPDVRRYELQERVQQDNESHCKTLNGVFQSIIVELLFNWISRNKFVLISPKLHVKYMGILTVNLNVNSHRDA